MNYLPAVEAAVKDIASYHACYDGDCPHASHTECLAALIIAGWSACLQHLSEQGAEFDERAAGEARFKADAFDIRRTDLAWLEGARWQHAQDAAVIAALRAERDQYRQWNDQSLKTAHEREDEIAALKAENITLLEVAGQEHIARTTALFMRRSRR